MRALPRDGRRFLRYDRCMQRPMTMTAPTLAATPRANLLRGIVFMCLASTLFPIMNGLVQVLSQRYPSDQIVWLRTGGHLLFVLALFAPKFGFVRLITTTVPKWQIARSVVLLASTFCFFTGVKSLPLAKAASISFTAPFIVALLALPMLGEKISFVRLACVLMGFVGVLIVIQPGTDLFQWASLYIVASATCYGLYQVLTRRVAGQDPPETSAVYSALVGTVLMSFVAPWSWVPMQSAGDVALMASLGILGGLGHFCVAKAMTFAPASVVAPFQYWQMIGSVTVGYLFMGSMPTATTWLGAGIIVAAGLFIGWRETREKTVA
jgi:drug/metabolite transporter (DMT)-like permease